MALRLPTMYPIARSILAIPHTSCDVERSFSVWKRVRSEKQQSMKEGTHKAYVSFCFNGVVPPQKTCAHCTRQCYVNQRSGFVFARVSCQCFACNISGYQSCHGGHYIAVNKYKHWQHLYKGNAMWFKKAQQPSSVDKVLSFPHFPSFSPISPSWGE